MKNTIILAALGLSVCSGAAASTLSIEKTDNLFERHENALTLLSKKGYASEKKLRANVAAKAMEVTEVITEVSGNRVLMQKEASGIYSSLNYLYEYEASDLLSKLVYSEDGSEVYFQTILTKSGLTSYVKGTVCDNEITVSLPQTVAWFENGSDSYGVNLCIASFGVDNEGMVTSEVQTQIDTVTFTIDPENGEIELNLPGNEGQYMLALAYSDDSTWTGFGDFTQHYMPTDIELLSMPEDVEPQTYSFIEGKYGYRTEVAFKDGYLYIKGLCEELPDGVLRASYDEATNTAQIPQDQFIGIYEGQYLIITKVVIPQNNTIVLAPETMEFTLTVDREKEEIYPAQVGGSPSYLCFNADPSRVFYLQIIRDFIMKVQDTYAGTPLNPFNLLYEEAFLDLIGYTSFYFFVPFVSTVNTLLDESCLYYRVFMDGELMEFTSDPSTHEYMGLDGTVSELPVMFNNMNDIYHEPYSAEREVGLYTEGFDTLGVQMVYRYDDEVTVSDIITLDIHTGEVINSGSGVESLTVGDIVSCRYYDLQGRIVSNPDKGLYIRSVTLTDGSVVTDKVRK